MTFRVGQEGSTPRKSRFGCAARFQKLLPYFRPKSVVFPAIFVNTPFADMSRIER